MPLMFFLLYKYVYLIFQFFMCLLQMDGKNSVLAKILTQTAGKRNAVVNHYKKKSIRRTSKRGQGSFVRGWAKQSPGTHERTVMLERCGKKCFLGPQKSFPICSRGTCKRNKKGVYAAYIRAREYTTIKGSEKYRRIARTAKRMLRR